MFVSRGGLPLETWGLVESYPLVFETRGNVLRVNR
jgi:hypothetical protein